MGPILLRINTYFGVIHPTDSPPGDMNAMRLRPALYSCWWWVCSETTACWIQLLVLGLQWFWVQSLSLIPFNEKAWIEKFNSEELNNKINYTGWIRLLPSNGLNVVWFQIPKMSSNTKESDELRRGWLKQPRGGNICIFNEWKNDYFEVWRFEN